MAGYNPGMFSEVALVSITPKGGTEVQFASMVNSIDIDEGARDIEQVATLSGGRLIKKVPQELTTITFEGYPIGLATTSPAKGIAQFFYTLTASYDTTEPLVVTSSLARDSFRIAVLLAEDIGLAAGPTSASAASTAAKAAYRLGFYNCFMTSMKTSFTDGELKCTFEFKVSAFNKQGTAQIRHESTETTTALATLSTYNTTNFPEDGTSFTF